MPKYFSCYIQQGCILNKQHRSQRQALKCRNKSIHHQNHDNKNLQKSKECASDRTLKSERLLQSEIISKKQMQNQIFPAKQPKILQHRHLARQLKRTFFKKKIIKKIQILKKRTFRRRRLSYRRKRKFVTLDQVISEHYQSQKQQLNNFYEQFKSLTIKQISILFYTYKKCIRYNLRNELIFKRKNPQRIPQSQIKQLCKIFYKDHYNRFIVFYHYASLMYTPHNEKIEWDLWQYNELALKLKRYKKEKDDQLKKKVSLILQKEKEKKEKVISASSAIIVQKKWLINGQQQFELYLEHLINRFSNGFMGKSKSISILLYKLSTVTKPSIVLIPEGQRQYFDKYNYYDPKWKERTMIQYENTQMMKDLFQKYLVPFNPHQGSYNLLAKKNKYELSKPSYAPLHPISKLKETVDEVFQYRQGNQSRKYQFILKYLQCESDPIQAYNIIAFNIQLHQFRRNHFIKKQRLMKDHWDQSDLIDTFPNFFFMNLKGYIRCNFTQKLMIKHRSEMYGIISKVKSTAESLTLLRLQQDQNNWQSKPRKYRKLQ